MKEAFLAVLVDPIDDSAETMRRLVSGLPSVRVAEVLSSYEGAARRVAAIGPDLVIVNMDDDPAQAVDLIRTVVQNSPGVAILPASRVRDSSIILSVIRAGAREFLTLPTQPEVLTETIARLVHRAAEVRPQATAAPPPGSGSRVVAVTGAAGGVGCTTIAVNLATTLAKTVGHEVVLADFDLMLGSLDACLDIIPDQTLQGVVQNIDRLDHTLLKRSMTRHASGLFVLPHPVAMEDSAKIEPEALRQVLGLLKAAFPTVIIDTSKGLQSSDFTAFEMADIILVVLQLDLTCLRNTARLIHLFGQFEGYTERVRLVVNRTGSQESDISLKKAEEALKMPVSWHIPNATKVIHAARAKGVPIDAVAAGSRVHQSILALAKGVRPAPAVVEVKARRGLFAAFF